MKLITPRIFSSSFKLLENKPYLCIILIALASIVLHYKIFTLDLQGIHVWRQTQTQINIQNFYRHDNNILNPRHNNFSWGDNIQRMEFPIMQWSIAQVERVFGEKIIVTRICIFLIGLMSVFGFFQLFQLLFKNMLLSFLSAWCFNFSPVFYYYTLNPIPDNLALCGAIWSWVYFYKFKQNRVWRYVFISAAFLCLSVLAKLPFILIGGVYFLYLVSGLVRRENDLRFTFKFSIIFIALLLPAVAWYFWVIPTWGGNGIVKGILENKIDWVETKRILEYHRDVMFPKLLLNRGAVVFFCVGIVSLVFNGRLFKNNAFEIAFGSLFALAYLFFELNMINTVHDYYMMPFLPFLFVAVGYGIKQLLDYKILKPLVVLYVLIVIPRIAHKDAQNAWMYGIDGEFKDLFQYREEFRKAAPQDALCIILNDESTYVFSYLIDKQGFIFQDNFPAPWMPDMIDNKGARFMYSNNRTMDENPEISKFFDALVLQIGTIKVFKLKAAQ